MNDRSAGLQEAIDSFPLVSWLSKHTRTYPNEGGAVVYADCPVCTGRKKLGIYRSKKLAVCGRCKDGGHGQGKWEGVANLPRLVKMLEGTSWRDTFKLIHALSGIPEPEWKPEEAPDVSIPKDAISLTSCHEEEPGVSYLRTRGVGHLVESASLCIGGKYHERVILPCYYRDEYIGFEAKAIYPSQTPKSLYPPGMATRKKVYTLRDWRQKATWAAVTESVVDCETFSPIGNAIGCFGVFKRGQLASLVELDQIKDLYWFLDGDAWKHVQSGIKACAPFVRNHVVPMPNDQDPNSLGTEGCGLLMESAREVRTDLDFLEVTHEWGKDL